MCPWWNPYARRRVRVSLCYFCRAVTDGAVLTVGFVTVSACCPGRFVGLHNTYYAKLLYLRAREAVDTPVSALGPMPI